MGLAVRMSRRAIVAAPADPFVERDGHVAPQSPWAAAAYPPGDIRRYFRVLSGGPRTPPRPRYGTYWVSAQLNSPSLWHRGLWHYAL